MIKVNKEYYCDLCYKEGAKTYRTLARFHTEQTEGRTVKPYITSTEIELCDECVEKVAVINGKGAQGVNDFWLVK